MSDSAVSLGVLSKSYGLAGLRIGWVATRNQAILTRMAELKDYTTDLQQCSERVPGYPWLAHRKILATRNLAIIEANLALLDRFFATHDDRFEWRRPKAGPIAFPRSVPERLMPFATKS